MKNEKIKSNLGLSLENDSSSHLANCVLRESVRTRDIDRVSHILIHDM